MNRPSRESIHMTTARLWSQRSLCSQPDRKVGAVITDAHLKRVLSVGYNGPARTLPNDHCGNGAWRMVGPAPEGLSKCHCLHAEENAILALTSRERGMQIFVTMSPCYMCAQRIIQVGIVRVAFCDQYRDTSGIDLLKSAGVRVNGLYGWDQLR